MVHELSKARFDLDAINVIDDWLAGDDRVLAFKVVDGDGNAVDISTATVRWALFEKEYHDADSDRVISGDDSGVEIVTDSRVDTSTGEWEVRIDGEATADLWGEYTHRPEVEDADGGVASWRGTVILSA